MVVYPLFVLILSGLRTLPLSALALVGVGWGGMVFYNMANTLLQTLVADEFRGRVMSIYSLIMFGGIPLGALWAGALANFIGAPLTLVISSLIALIFTGIFWVRVPELRRLL